MKFSVVGWTIDNMTKELLEVTKEFDKMKKQHVEIRKSYIDDLATAMARDKKTTKAAMIRQLSHLEEQRATFKRLAQVNKKFANLTTSYVTVRGEDGKKIDLTDPTKIDEALKNENQRKYHQTEATCPFLHEPLKSHFGATGVGPETENLLQGTYTIPASVQPETKEFLEACQLPSAQVETSLPRSVKDFKTSWQKMREDTGTGTIHFGHFKAATFHQTNLLLHYAMAEIPFRSGYTPSRWLKATNVMILKKEGITDIDRLRTIVLFEADYNHNNKFLGRSMMSHCNKHNLLAKEQYSVPGKKCIDHVINRRLTYDIVRYQKISLAMGSVDLSSCYDRIAHAPAYLAMRGFGIPSEPIHSMFETYQNIQFSSKSVHGKSKTTFGGMEDNFIAKPQGVGQGNGAGPPVWAVVSSRMFQILKKRNLVAKFSRPITKEELEICGFAFVDDSDIIATSNNTHDPVLTLTKMQQTLDQWEAAAKVTGGALEPRKSFGYLVYFQWKDGKWAYGKLEKTHQLTALDKDNNRVNITMKQPHEALNMLGVHLAPDGNQDQQFRYMYRKALQLGEYMRNGFVTKEESFIALQSIASKVIEYPLPATSLSADKLRSIMWQLLQSYLPKSGMNRNFPRDLLYADPMYQGMGVNNPYILQGCKHVHDMAEHMHKNTTTGQFIKITLEYLRVELGLNIDIMQTPYTNYTDLNLTNSWVLSTWEFCTEQGITFEDDTIKFPLLREGDSTINDIFLNSTNVPKKHLKTLNKCRLYLRAFSLSDIVTGDGTKVAHNAGAGIRTGNSGRKDTSWPVIHKPTTAEWKIWREALRNTLCTRRLNKLDQPLGRWIQENMSMNGIWIHTHQTYSTTTIIVGLFTPQQPTDQGIYDSTLQGIRVMYQRNLID